MTSPYTTKPDHGRQSLVPTIRALLVKADDAVLNGDSRRAADYEDWASALGAGYRWQAKGVLCSTCGDPMLLREIIGHDGRLRYCGPCVDILEATGKRCPLEPEILVVTASTPLREAPPPMTPLELVLSKLPKARQNGRGWNASCPAHDDRNPSLSVCEGNDGRALLRCHAGCETEAVVSAIGLQMSDLMANNTTEIDNAPRNRRQTESSSASANAKTYPTARDAVIQLERRHGKRSKEWVYHDEKSEPVGLIVRWDRLGRKKDLRPVSKIGSCWMLRGMPDPRPLYGLPDLLSNLTGRVYVCEGEKAADAARALGLVATTSAHGSESAGKTDWTPLTGRDVVILPDNDVAGRKYANTVACILNGLNPSAQVKIVTLPGVPDGGDIEQYIDSKECVESEDIRSRGGEITPRELAQGNRQYRPVAVATESLDALVKARCGTWLNRQPSSRGGRPSKVFHLGPVYDTGDEGARNEGSVDCRHIDNVRKRVLAEQR